MENTYIPVEGARPHTCISRFASGLKHASDHLDQIVNIIQQAQNTPRKVNDGDPTSAYES
jgi:transcription initiation factor TFIIIB Brf1 subunit/transcription initiation factor TFIIB